MFAVSVSGVAPPAWAGGQADLQRRVHSLQAAEDPLVLWSAQPIAHELEKLGGDGAFGRAMVWVAGESHVLACGRRAPRLDAIVPVVRNRTEMTGRHVLAGLVGKL